MSILELSRPWVLKDFSIYGITGYYWKVNVPTDDIDLGNCVVVCAITSPRQLHITAISTLGPIRTRAQ